MFNDKNHGVRVFYLFNLIFYYILHSNYWIKEQNDIAYQGKQGLPNIAVEIYKCSCIKNQFIYTKRKSMQKLEDWW